MQFNNKELQLYASAGFNAKYGGIEANLYTQIMLSLLPNYPYDMFVFEYDKGKLCIRLAGYNFITNELDEKTIIYVSGSLEVDTFWFKIDDHGDFYVGTFLFPQEY